MVLSQNRKPSQTGRDVHVARKRERGTLRAWSQVLVKVSLTDLAAGRVIESRI